MKTLFLAERENHVREALRLILEHQPEYMLIGEASTAESLLAQVCQQPPDLILLDWNLTGMHHQRLLDALRQCCPETIILATSVKQEHETTAIKLGAEGFLSKQLPPDQFIAALANALE